MRAEIAGLFGLVKANVGGDGDRGDDDQRSQRPTEKPEKTGKKRKKGDGKKGDGKKRASIGRQLRRLRAVLRQGALGESWRFLKALWASLGARDVHVKMTVGMDDPAATGELWGMLMPLLLLARATPHDISVQPVFDREALAVVGVGTLRLVPLRVIAVVLGVLLRPRVLKSVWAAVRTK